nr:MAG TPA_asm: hypothetical protein [Caudoviricetes sp.]
MRTPLLRSIQKKLFTVLQIDIFAIAYIGETNSMMAKYGLLSFQ